ncbi:MAG: hypothetical protein KDD37_11505, partial [Bdellovibrionales bacterium]|nr:hypothetical protein [Bdellovibrionales bacterium]
VRRPGRPAPNASEMQIKEKKDGWYRVDLSSIKNCASSGVKEGWVFGSPLFKPLGMFETAQVIHAPSGLRVRDSESSKSKIHCNLKDGDVVSVIGPSVKNPNWLRVNVEKMPGCNVKEAFVYRDYLEEQRSYTLVERDLPVPEGIDPVDGNETEGAAGCTNCTKDSNVSRSLLREIYDELSDIFNSQMISADEKMVKDYSESPEVEALISCAERNVRPGPTGYCYRYVKNALLGGNLSSTYLNGVPAKKAGAELRREGYTNLLQLDGWDKKILSPYDAPKGAILVYDGGQYGHIEIKSGDVGEGGFISDYYSESSRVGQVSNGLSGRGRTLIGVYVKDVKGVRKNENNRFVCPRPRRT